MPGRKTKKQKKIITRPLASKKRGRVSRREKVVKSRGIRLELFLIVIGILLMGFSLTHRMIQYRSLRISRSQAAEILRKEPAPLPLPVHISIPWNTDADIESLPMENNEWQISDTKVTYLLGSALPGEAGNIILYGHNKREILGNIRALKGGEKITLTTSDGIKHSYAVWRIQEVDPSEVSWLMPTKEEILTLYTCSGYWDMMRFLVQARPI